MMRLPHLQKMTEMKRFHFSINQTSCFSTFVYKYVFLQKHLREYVKPLLTVEKHDMINFYLHENMQLPNALSLRGRTTKWNQMLLRWYSVISCPRKTSTSPKLSVI